MTKIVYVFHVMMLTNKTNLGRKYLFKLKYFITESKGLIYIHPKNKTDAGIYVCTRVLTYKGTSDKLKYKMTREVCSDCYHKSLNDLFPLTCQKFGQVFVMTSKSYKSQKHNKSISFSEFHPQEEPIKRIRIPRNEIVKYITPNMRMKRGIMTIAGYNVFINVINCDTHKQRFEDLVESLHKSGLIAEREPCVYGTKLPLSTWCSWARTNVINEETTDNMNKIEVSISQSHINSWKTAKDVDFTITMEDDVMINTNFSYLLAATLTYMKTSDSKMDTLYLCHSSTFGYPSSLFKRLTKSVSIRKLNREPMPGGVAYLFSREKIKYLKSRAFPILKPIDVFMGINNGNHAYGYNMKGNVSREERYSPLVGHPQWTEAQSSQN